MTLYSMYITKYKWKNLGHKVYRAKFLFVFKKCGNILMRLFSRKFLVFGLTLEYSISCFGNKYCRLDVPIHDGVFELSFYIIIIAECNICHLNVENN